MMQHFLHMGLALAMAHALPNQESHSHFELLKGQILAGESQVLLAGTAEHVETAALLCMKYEKCAAFSFVERQHRYDLLAVYSVIISEEENMETPEVYMKVLREFQEDFFTGVWKYLAVALEPMGPSVPFHTIAAVLFASCLSLCTENPVCLIFNYGGYTGTCVLYGEDQNENIIIDPEVLDKLYYKKVANIAQDKFTVQSSTLPYQPSVYGNDGMYSSHCTTRQDERPYWIVNLEESCDVFAVRVYNMMNWMPQYPIHNPVVYVGVTQEITYRNHWWQQIYNRPSVLDHPVCGYIEGHITYEIMDFNCSAPLTGSYVFIDSYDNDHEHYLYFAELEVYGDCV